MGQALVCLRCLLEEETLSKPEKLTRSLAMAAYCHQCLGYYQDGKQDCEAVSCPLYKWMPYGKKEPDLGWLELNPRMKGKVTWEESEREMSDEARQAAADRMRNLRSGNDS